MSTPAATPQGVRAEGRIERARGLLRPGAEWVVLGAVLMAAFVYLAWETRGNTLWFDEWEWLVNRRSGGVHTFLEPHNQHLSLVPVAIFKLLFSTAGLDDYRPYRAVVIGLHLLCAVLLYVLARRRVGPWLALLPALCLICFGPGWQNFLWPFQIGWLASLAAALGALLALERSDLRGDLAAAALLAVSLGSSGLGLAVAVGLFAELAWTRASRRRLWVVIAPMILYGLWYARYGESGSALAAPWKIVGFAANAAASAVGALAGLSGSVIPDKGGSLAWGRPLTVLAVLVLVASIVRGRGVTPRLIGLISTAVAFWLLTGLGRGGFSYAIPTRAGTCTSAPSSSCSSRSRPCAGYGSKGGRPWPWSAWWP